MLKVQTMYQVRSVNVQILLKVVTRSHLGRCSADFVSAKKAPECRPIVPLHALPMNVCGQVAVSRADQQLDCLRADAI